MVVIRFVPSRFTYPCSSKAVKTSYAAEAQRLTLPTFGPSVGWRPYKEMFLLAFVFAAVWFVTGSMAAHLPRLLERAGVSPVQAIAASALVGPAQVAARLVEFVVLPFSCQP